ncbi:MAG: hypothetical protein NC548_41310 [Lachnospiraceae bacterium]|nr:hypothetical protein [Lachnospiraceae bacterium]
MGYSADMDIMKRSVIEREMGCYPNVTFEELWEHYLFAWAYQEDYPDIPKEEAARDLCWTYHTMFRKIECLGGKYEDARIVERDVYEKVCESLRKTLESTVMISLVDMDDEGDELIAMVDVYRRLITTEIDWETEVVVYHCG